MKATCKLCNAVIETPPDPHMDADRERRERTAFFQEVARHIDPRFKNCTANNQKSIPARMNQVTQDNGWFQRWRLLWLVDTTDEKLLAKKEEWREYLHAITAAVDTTPAEATKEPETLLQ
jgi:hypothetical protein